MLVSLLIFNPFIASFIGVFIDGFLVKSGSPFYAFALPVISVILWIIYWVTHFKDYSTPQNKDNNK